MIQRIDVPTGADGGTAESEYTPPSTQGKSFGNGGGDEHDGDIGSNGNGGIVEGCGDGGDPGAGDKLLHLLRMTKQVGPLVMMMTRMLWNDFMHWIALLLVIVVAIASALYVLWGGRYFPQPAFEIALKGVWRIPTPVVPGEFLALEEVRRP